MACQGVFLCYSIFMDRAGKAAGILLFVAIIMAGEPHITAASHQQSTNPETSTALAFIDDSAAQAQATNSQNDSPHWYASLKRPEWWLVLVGFITFFAIWHQARETANAVKAMKDETDILRESVSIARVSAKAAEASTNALINSERAWVMAELEWANDRPGNFGWGSGGGFEGATTWARLSLNCSNEGKTPAWIIQKRVRIEIVEAIPPKPQFPPLNPEWEFENSEPEPLAPGRNHKVFFDITCRDKWDFEVEILTDRELIAYGFVRYRDAFQVERETRFGYRFAKSTKEEVERIEGFPEYNKHT